MNRRTLVFITAAIAASAALLFVYLRWWGGIEPSELLTRLPQSRLIAAINLQALRASGVLELLGGKTAEEPDYKQFVSETGFNYRTDLDHVLAAISGEETLAFLTGRFDWNKLNEYAVKHGGKCVSGVCSMDGSKPQRKISFTRVRSTILAFASSSDSDAVTKVGKPLRTAVALPAVSRMPIWLSIPPAMLRDGSAVPTGARMFATAVAEADEVSMGIGAEGDHFLASLEAICKTADQATQARRELEAATTLLQRMLAREKQQPSVKDLSGVLTLGAFSTDGARLTARWPIEKVFFENLGAPQ